jgi:Anaphase-promoting complex, subunit 10 (APC10)
MHQNGRDTHVRQVQLYGPRTTANLDNTFRETDPAVICNHDQDTSVVDDLKKRTMDDAWSTVAMSQFSSIR